MSRFSEIAKLLGVAVEDVAKMAPEEIVAKLKRPNSQILEESKAAGKSVHILPDNAERKRMMQLADEIPTGTIKKAAAVAPSMGLGEGFKTFREEFAQPVSDRWEKLKSAVYGPVSKQLNLSKDPEQAKQIEGILSTVADPTNLLPGGAGLAAGALQVLGSKEESDSMPEEKPNRFNKLKMP